MTKVKTVFWALLIVLSALWLLADTLLPEPLTYFSFRHAFMQYSGFMGMAVMSIAMVLAVRPRWLEKPMGGLDKMYRLHKWLGITALVVAVLHWWWARGTKWMVGWGWLERPPRGAGAGAEVTLSGFEQWMRGQRGLAESLGEWAFYAAVILIALALIRAFPYHLFTKTHRWLAVAYLVLVYHTLILFEIDYWTQPLGWTTAILLVAGVIAAALVLTRRVAQSRRVPGTIESLNTYPGVSVVEGRIHLEKGWPGHTPGQFAFVTSKRSEGAHPYTIASAWNPDDPSLTFVVKALGDWTGQLGEWLREGLPVEVEGPYGCFDFRDDRPRQIWIGAGIGITPFIARMTYLARHPGGPAIDLFHTTTDFDQAAIDRLKADARAAGIRLHLIVTPTDGRLTPEQIRESVPEWQSASLWFCGPAAFGDLLRKDFTAHGLPRGRFHQELFAMR